MFEDAIIVQSAVSAFNNAALAAPAFLWSAILTLPLYVIVWLLADKITSLLGWTHANILKQASFWTIIITFGWIVLFGGNYGVLRDDTSILPFLIALLVFVLSAFIGARTNKDILSKRENLPYVILGIIMLGLSDLHAWWGPLLQIAAAFGGFSYGGRIVQSKMRDVPSVLFVIMAVTTVMLMQPEFFRFGQLGNLTWVHSLAVVTVGGLVAATVAVRNIVPSGKIHQSAYVKLKWLARFIAILGFAVFIMTESVPVFLGLISVLFILFAMSIWHTNKTPAALGDELYAVTILAFGIITTMPVISALGILYLLSLPHDNLWAESKYLL